MTTASVPVQATPAISFRELLAAEVRAHLARRRLSNRSFAKLLGVQPTWIDRRLNGATPIDSDDIQLFSETLGITPAQLMAGALAPDVVGGVKRVCSSPNGAVVIPFPQVTQGHIVPDEHSSACSNATVPLTAARHSSESETAA